ncbi:hypothetical protein WMY93_012681 [Mugilogobius chulae]|uniref:EGF-like repeat and discoidin I-like domain-containing protein 3 n=1 Tax=Mugilogobius chulae TaxID=88201 RepID=A0AAW0NXA6_9GOBI
MVVLLESSLLSREERWSFGRVTIEIFDTRQSCLAGDYCKVNHCVNGGTCVTGVGEEPFICICADGFGGDTCNLTENGPCSPNPCQNDGTCEVLAPTRRGDVFNEYICRCQLGFEGVHCQINVNDCATKPCKNGGLCRDLDGDYTCQCSSPYVGKQCQHRCISLLGMEGGSIVESQISASSVHYGIMGLQRWGPELARLNNQGIVNAWTSASHDRNPWIQIDIQKTMRLTGIITQGASRMGTAEFIKAYKIASSLDGQSYSMYKAQGQRRDKVFVGNVDNDSTKTNMFDPPIVAQYIRIILWCVGEPALCAWSWWAVSSMFIRTRQYARLDKQGKTNAWSPANNNHSEWLQVDLEKTKRISGIITQGAKDFGVVQFISVFKVAYSNDGQNWRVLKDENTGEDKLFRGNVDNNTHKKNVFEPSFFARYVRILPWEWHERITLRMELLGCDD